ncbi:MAG TPA: tRNA (adenosine(37)-N6)-threonylcarbamoyltransferase complex dimerization subunit type 1 TsaB [Nitrospirota bacterium]|nr:tRNA (adenosine(37)-N6)-threonylcarbamoyltransferase complex dimerization subunit type 1 TsaB [Nitrospirota bacterium]
MIILGIDTSTKTGSIAIVSGRGVMAQYTLNLEITHSERLMASVDRVLTDTGMSLSQMDAFAVSLGPGSFTGLRIGLATVKGLALASDKPVAGVPTLKALAWNLPHAAFPVCTLLDARKNEVYAALYTHEEGRMRQTMEETVLPLVRLRERVSEKAIFTGEAALQFREEIERLFGGNAVFAPLSALLPSAAAVAEIGLEMIADNCCHDPDSLVPLYIRRPEAEVAWEKQSGLK